MYRGGDRSQSSFCYRGSTLRRLLDVIGAGLGLFVLAPLLILISAAVKLQDGGPVFYRARRVGLRGSILHVMKFRTMVPHADKLGGAITVGGDSRVTSIGRVLRRFKLDELPQLWNVVVGDMSLVGPRPEDPRYVALYQPGQRKILNHKPGITSPASLRYSNEEAVLSGPQWERHYLESVMPEKLAVDIDYFTRRTLGSDILLILRTIVKIAT